MSRGSWEWNRSKDSPVTLTVLARLGSAMVSMDRLRCQVEKEFLK